MSADEKCVTLRECDTKHNALDDVVKRLECRMDRLESKFWWIITLLVGNLIGVITMLIRAK